MLRVDARTTKPLDRVTPNDSYAGLSMAFGIRLHVWGDYACFTRPEMKAERVSYDVITPSAARGILEAVHWKPAIRWVIDRIHVLKPIRFETLRRNELGSKIPLGTVRKAAKSGSSRDLHTYVESDRQQRAATLLRDVGYVIEAHFDLNRRCRTGRYRSQTRLDVQSTRRKGAMFQSSVPRYAGIRRPLRAGDRRDAPFMSTCRSTQPGSWLDVARHRLR